MPKLPVVKVECPAWVEGFVTLDRTYASDDEKMKLAVALARENVARASGGPFGAAIFAAETNQLVAVGVNLVVPLNNSTLHAEMVAFMMAQARLRTWKLGDPKQTAPQHELFTSCEPCAMCLGATLWSGVKRVVCAATRADALEMKFDEGPVFPESYAYLAARGVRVEYDHARRQEAKQILATYCRQQGTIYNG